MSFISFLMEYYVWIILALIILIIGVVGFLVDSSRKKAKVNMNMQQSNDVQSNSQNGNVSNGQVAGDLGGVAALGNGGTNNSGVMEQFEMVPSNGLPASSVETGVQAAPAVEPQVEQPVAVPTVEAQVTPVVEPQVEQPVTVPTAEVQVTPVVEPQVEQPVVVPTVEAQDTASSSDVGVSNGTVVSTANSQPFDVNSMFSSNQ